MASPVLSTIAEKLDVGKIGEFDTIISQMNAMPRKEIVEFFQRIQANLPRARKSNSHFSYAANSELSGFPAGNPTYENRSERLKQACYFAACYADQLVLIDPFARVLKTLEIREIDSTFIFEFSL